MIIVKYIYTPFHFTLNTPRIAYVCTCAPQSALKFKLAQGPTQIMSAEPSRTKSYSEDLRWRVVWQRISMDLSFRAIARNLNIFSHVLRTLVK